MSALLAEYERLAMMQSCLAQGLDAPAMFEVHVRRLPPSTGYLVAAGLEQVLQYLKSFSFSEAEHSWLGEQSPFSAQFLAYAKTLRFEGDVFAMPEGSIFFAGEPVLRISAAFPLAQYLETRVLNLLQFEISVCSWASRLVSAAGGRRLIDAGLRFAHGHESDLLASRACFIAGFSGTSSLDACRRFKIPLARTLTASRPGSSPADPDSLEQLVHGTTLGGTELEFVRLLGDELANRAFELRSALDAQGLQRLGILAAGEFDAEQIAALVASAAPIDAFAPTRVLPHAGDLLAADAVYALAPRGPGPLDAPVSTGRQVWREAAGDGTFVRDTVMLDGPSGPPGARPLLQPVMHGGRRIGRAITLEEARDHHAQQRLALPIAPTPAVEVRRSDDVADASNTDLTRADLRAHPTPH